jgi:acid phosphatase family membrane protein YuiD
MCIVNDDFRGLLTAILIIIVLVLYDRWQLKARKRAILLNRLAREVSNMKAHWPGNPLHMLLNDLECDYSLSKEERENGIE